MILIISYSLVLLWIILQGTKDGRRAYLVEKLLKESEQEKRHKRASQIAREKSRTVNYYTQVNIDKAIIMKGENDDEPYRTRTGRHY